VTAGSFETSDSKTKSPGGEEYQQIAQQSLSAGPDLCAPLQQLSEANESITDHNHQHDGIMPGHTEYVLSDSI
jgi:hypothetical protein